MPGFRRPRTRSQWLVRITVWAGSSTSGTTNSGLSQGRNPRGSTPMTVKLVPLSRTDRPTMSASAPKRRRQSWSVSTTTLSRPGWSSSGAKVRPKSGRARRTRNPAGDIRRPPMRSGSPAPVRFRSTAAKAASPSNVVLWVAQSVNTPAETELRCPCRGASQTWTSRAGSSKGSDLSNTPLTTLNMAVFAPMPRARVKAAAAVKPGALTSWRTAYLTSSIGRLPGRCVACDMRGAL
jgi:hypothetical protein